METRFRFTNERIRALPANPPEAKSTDLECSDTEVVGLKCLSGRTGQKRFLLRYRTLDGKKRSLTLGRFPTLDVNAARFDLFLIAMLLELKKVPEPCVMKEAEAKEHLIKGLRKLFKWRPELKDYLRKEGGKSRIWIKTNNHIEIDERLVRKIYRECTNTEVKRSDSEYKFHFNGINPFGYRYRLDYLKYPVTEKAEKELLTQIATSTEGRKGLITGRRNPPKRKVKKVSQVKKAA